LADFAACVVTYRVGRTNIREAISKDQQIDDNILVILYVPADKNLIHDVSQRFIEAYNAISRRPNGPNKKEFCEAVGISASNWSKYERGERPIDLTSIVAMTSRYNVASDYLLFGRGEIFSPKNDASGTTQTGNFNQAGTGNTQKVKGNRNNVQAANGDHANITNNVKLEDCKRDLAASEKEVEHLRAQLAAAESLVASKDVTIASKEETISVLRAAFNRPN
jgi:transcriptional regulator with XRE-family HTH domain